MVVLETAAAFARAAARAAAAIAGGTGSGIVFIFLELVLVALRVAVVVEVAVVAVVIAVVMDMEEVLADCVFFLGVFVVVEVLLGAAVAGEEEAEAEVVVARFGAALRETVDMDAASLVVLSTALALLVVVASAVSFATAEVTAPDAAACLAAKVRAFGTTAPYTISCLRRRDEDTADDDMESSPPPLLLLMEVWVLVLVLVLMLVLPLLPPLLALNLLGMIAKATAAADDDDGDDERWTVSKGRRRNQH